MLVDKAGKEVTPGMWVLTFFQAELVLMFITHASQFMLVGRTKYGWKRMVNKQHTASDLFVIDETIAKDIINQDYRKRYEELKTYLR